MAQISSIIIGWLWRKRPFFYAFDLILREPNTDLSQQCAYLILSFVFYFQNCVLERRKENCFGLFQKNKWVWKMCYEKREEREREERKSSDRTRRKKIKWQIEEIKIEERKNHEREKREDNVWGDWKSWERMRREKIMSLSFSFFF